jgi:hypothetical protein
MVNSFFMLLAAARLKPEPLGGLEPQSEPEREGFHVGDEFTTGWLHAVQAQRRQWSVSMLQAMELPTAKALLSDEALAASNAEIYAAAPPMGLKNVPEADMLRLQQLAHLPSVGDAVRTGLGRCAVVGSSGVLHDPPNATVAAAIDAHDSVIRFNDAPTVGFEDSVGRRTTHRIVHRDSFDAARQLGEAGNATDAPQLIYMGHHASDFGAPNDEAAETTTTDMVGALVAAGAWVINPQHISQSRELLLHTSKRLPSSGFEGIALALAMCDGPVDLYGYGATTRCERYYVCHAGRTGDDYYKSGTDYHDLTREAEVREQLEAMNLVRIAAAAAAPSA